MHILGTSTDRGVGGHCGKWNPIEAASLYPSGHCIGAGDPKATQSLNI